MEEENEVDVPEGIPPRETISQDQPSLEEEVELNWDDDEVLDYEESDDLSEGIVEPLYQTETVLTYEPEEEEAVAEKSQGYDVVFQKHVFSKWEPTIYRDPMRLHKGDGDDGSKVSWKFNHAINSYKSSKDIELTYGQFTKANSKLYKQN